MKPNAVLMTCFTMLASAVAIGFTTGCSKNSAVNTTQVGDAAPTVETQSAVQQKIQCAIAETVLSKPSAQALKSGLDAVIRELPAADIEVLAEAAHVWRRSNPSAKYSETAATEIMRTGVETLNSIGVQFLLQGLVRHAPALKVGGGSFYAHVAGFPDPKVGSTDKSTMREMYLDIPAYGLTYGESFADSGLGVFGQLYTDVDTKNIAAKNFTVTLIYSAAASKYGVRILESGDTTNGPIKSEDCSKFPVMASFVKLPRPQTTIRECEFGGCKNLPKD